MSQPERKMPVTTFPSICPRCEAPVALRDMVWNMLTKKKVRILECTRCRRLVWDD